MIALKEIGVLTHICYEKYGKSKVWVQNFQEFEGYFTWNISDKFLQDKMSLWLFSYSNIKK